MTRFATITINTTITIDGHGGGQAAPPGAGCYAALLSSPAVAAACSVVVAVRRRGDTVSAPGVLPERARSGARRCCPESAIPVDGACAPPSPAARDVCGTRERPQIVTTESRGLAGPRRRRYRGQHVRGGKLLMSCLGKTLSVRWRWKTTANAYDLADLVNVPRRRVVRIGDS